MPVTGARAPEFGGRPVVFVGPSLDLATAARHLDAEFRPPVRRGDIDAILAGDRLPAALGIVDGVFFQEMSISPKEVLRAVDRGITVFGSSSIGALRAVECACYGMVGIGRIYQAYRSGAIDADDEVAIVCDPETNAALSEPLVNMRFAVQAALAAGAVTAGVAARFLEIAKELYFPQRSVRAVLRLLAAELGEPECASLRRFLAERAPDTKRADAIALLAAIRSWSAPDPDPAARQDSRPDQ